MYYTSRSIKLHNRCLKYLELIQDANNRYEDKRSVNASYDINKPRLRYPVKPMNYDFNTEYMERMKKLSFWLSWRMQNVITALGEENIKQIRKVMNETTSTNEVNTIEL